MMINSIHYYATASIKSQIIQKSYYENNLGWLYS